MAKLIVAFRNYANTPIKTDIIANVVDHWVLATVKQFSYLFACDKIIFIEGQV